MSGTFSMNGQLSGSGMDSNAIIKGWKGDFSVNFENAKLHNINIEQIIDQAAAKNNLANKLDQNYDKYTDFQQLNATASLQAGVLRLKSLQVDSKALNITGAGSVGLQKMTCDVNLNVKLLQNVTGGKKEKQVVEILKKAPIPVHIYGDCTNLNYKVDLEKLLQEQAKEAVKEQATKAIDKYLGGDKADSVKKGAMEKVLGSLTRGR